MTPVLRWIKSHLVVVICAVIIVAAPVASYIVSTGMVEQLRTDLRSTASSVKDLDRYRSTTVSIEVPGGDSVSVSGIANPRLIEAYDAAVKRVAGEAEKVHDAGLDHNRRAAGRLRGADDILPGHFPVPGSKREFEEMPFRMHEALVNAYAGLLREVGAGMPPVDAEVAKDLERRRNAYVDGQRKDSVDDLNDTELEDMRKELSDLRLGVYRMRATGEDGGDPIRFYADEAVLGLPPAPSSLLPLATMFEWQWRYWVTEDVLRAFAAANGDEDVVAGPMKRILSFDVAPMGAEPAESAGGSGRGGGGGGGMGAPGMGAPGMGAGGGAPGRRGAGGPGFGSGGGNAAASGATAAGLPAHPGDAQVDPSAEAMVDPAISLTGRSSNNVYDVRVVDCRIVVATSGLPAVIDALAAENFMTVLDVRVTPADAFAAASEGFIYGVEPVSTVDLRIETIWFREWTADAMPPDLRTALGIQSVPSADTMMQDAG